MELGAASGHRASCTLCVPLFFQLIFFIILTRYQMSTLGSTCTTKQDFIRVRTSDVVCIPTYVRELLGGRVLAQHRPVVRIDDACQTACQCLDDEKRGRKKPNRCSFFFFFLVAGETRRQNSINLTLVQFWPIPSRAARQCAYPSILLGRSKTRTAKTKRASVIVVGS